MTPAWEEITAEAEEVAARAIETGAQGDAQRAQGPEVGARGHEIAAPAHRHGSPRAYLGGVFGSSSSPFFFLLDRPSAARVEVARKCTSFSGTSRKT